MRRADCGPTSNRGNGTGVLLAARKMVGDQGYDPNPDEPMLKTWGKTAFENGVGKPRWDFEPSQMPGANAPGIEAENLPPNCPPESPRDKARNESKSAIFSTHSTTDKRLRCKMRKRPAAMPRED